MTRHWHVFPVAFIVAAWIHGAIEAPPSSEFEKRVIYHDGIPRVVFLHFPGNIPPSRPKPVVLVLHGGAGAGAEEMAKRTGMNEIADREGFIAAYPQGVDGQWNDGRGKTFRRAKDNTGIDDVGFIAAVIRDLIRKGEADPARVYAMGLSNGGMMTFRLGIELGDRLAAIAAIIANLPENLAGKTPVRPLPVLVMNGTEDPMMPWNGGPVKVLGSEYGTVLSTDRTVRFWVDAAHLPPRPETTTLPDRVPADGCRAEMDVYRGPMPGQEVVLYRLRGAGHNLPGGNTPDRPALLGRKCMDIDGVEATWSFFRKHSLIPGKREDQPRPERWRPRITQVGDPKANYLNVEFTCDGKYMVWFEGAGGSAANGTVWHCGVNPETGDLVPPDGRGFRAFESASWGRANPGCDRQGPYYVGTDRDGRLLMVRPEGPRNGKVAPLAAPPDARRRAVYPTHLPDRAGGYVLFIQNESNPGAGTRANGNAWVELQYTDLSEPARVHSVVRQATPPAGFAPMDAGFVRWMRGRPLMTYGHMTGQGRTSAVFAFDAEQPGRRPFPLLSGSHHHIDPYPALMGQFEYIFSGIDGGPRSHIYRRKAGLPAAAAFELFRAIEPETSKLASPSLAQSHEPFLFRNRLYTVYQVNDKGMNFFDTTFRKPGEIWLADVSGSPVRQWLITPEDGAPVSEPEPLVAGDRAWVFYSRAVTEETAAGTDEPGRWRRGDRQRLQGRLGRKRPAADAGRGMPRLALYRAELPLHEGN